MHSKKIEVIVSYFNCDPTNGYTYRVFAILHYTGVRGLQCSKGDLDCLQQETYQGTQTHIWVLHSEFGEEISLQQSTQTCNPFWVLLHGRPKNASLSHRPKTRTRWRTKPPRMAGGGRDVVGVEAAHGLLGLEAGEDQVVAAEARAEEGVHGLGGGSGGGRGGAQARPERQALGEVDGDRMGADAEGAERSHGGHASCRLWVERKEGGAEVAGVLARGGRKRMHWVVCWRSEFMGYESFLLKPT